MEIFKTNPDGTEITLATKTRLLPWISSPISSLEAVKANSILEAIKAESVNIAIICANDRQIAMAILTKCINGFLKFINVGKGMNASQVLATIELILSDTNYRNLKPEDYKVFFELMMKGYFKSNYFDRMDGNVICECLNMYCNERADVVEQENIKTIAIRKETERSSGPIHADLLPILKDAIKNIPEELKKEKKPIVHSEKDLFVKECFSDFDTIYDKKPVKLVNALTRIIEFEGKKVDVVEYTEMRLVEWAKNKIL